MNSCQREVRTTQCCCRLVIVQNDLQQAVRRAMKPTFLAVFPLSLFCFLSLFLFRFCCCFVLSLFRCLFVCSLSLQAHRPVAVVVGHSLIQLNFQEGDRTDTWLGGLFVPSTKKQDLYSVQVSNTSRSFLSHPLSRTNLKKVLSRKTRQVYVIYPFPRQLKLGETLETFSVILLLLLFFCLS